MSVGEEKPTKWGVARRTDYVVYKKKNWFIQEPLAEKTFSWIRKNFQQRECSNGKFQRKSFVYQFALAFLQTKGMGFFSQGLGRAGGGYKDTPGCLDTFRSWGRRKDIWAEKKLARPLLFHLSLFFSFFCCTVAWQPLCQPFAFSFPFLLYQVSGSLATFKLATSFPGFSPTMERRLLSWLSP